MQTSVYFTVYTTLYIDEYLAHKKIVIILKLVK